MQLCHNAADIPRPIHSGWLIRNCFGEGEVVSIPSFGSFEVKKRLERVVVNPSSGVRMLVPPKLVLGFKPAASVKEQLKYGGGSDE